MEKYIFKHTLKITIFSLLHLFMANFAFAQTNITSVSGGSANRIPKYDNTFSIATSNIYDNGTMIGFNTTSPITGIHLLGTSYNQSSLICERQETSAYGGSLFFRSRKVFWGAIGNGIYIGTIVFQGPKTTSGNYGSGATIQAATTETWTDNATGGKLHLQTTANGSTTPTTRIAIEQNGYVGIGTTSPDAILHLNGSSGTTVKIVDGNQGAGKILTSDANGVASWSTPVSGIAWSLTGNSGTTAGTNFMGTTDNVDVVFKRNNVQAGLLNVSKWSTSFGVSALFSNTTGFSNTAIGYAALYSNTSGKRNTALGDSALYTNTSGICNTAVGYRALEVSTSGSYNTGLGLNALMSNSTGSYNTALGLGALGYNTSGTVNTAVGNYSLGQTTTGYNNTGCGYNALYANTTGYNNTAIGYEAGRYYNNAACTFLGYGTNTNNNYNGSTSVGYNATAWGDDLIVIGTSANTGRTGGYGSWQDWSDGRFKENIQEDVSGINFVKKLRPVTFTFNAVQVDSFLGIKQRMDTISDMTAQNRYYQRLNEVSQIRRTGFIAQEVDSVAQLIGYNFDGVHTPVNENDIYTIGYATFVVPIVKAIQEQQLMIDSMKQQMRITDSLLTVLQDCCLQGSKNISLPDNSSQMQNKSENTVQIELTNSNQPVLYQNEPNPFGNNTVIRYFIPENLNGVAFILFYDMFGNEIKSTEITDTGFGSIIVNTENLAAGIYSYSLILNNKMIETKKMLRKK